MRRNEIHAGPWPASALVEEVARPGNALGKVSESARIALPESAYSVSELVVPLGPSGWKLADLIASRTDVPGLGDLLDAAENRILTAGIQEADAFVEAVSF